jgi:predicted anti-sigma-YlaC factor YlaD
MHRIIEDHLEEVLAGSQDHPAAAHLAECGECREEVSDMQRHAAMLRAFRVPESVNEETLAPRPGFYARVMERIEAQRPIDIWQLFFDSAFSRRLALASVALAIFFGVYLVSSERSAQPVTISLEDQPGIAISQPGLPDKDTVLVDLVTYREQ